MKIEYRVLNGASTQSIEEQVKDLCDNDGFMPQGGVAVTVLGQRMHEDATLNGGIIESEVLYTQAMVKVTEVPGHAN